MAPHATTEAVFRCLRKANGQGSLERFFTIEAPELRAESEIKCRATRSMTKSLPPRSVAEVLEMPLASWYTSFIVQNISAVESLLSAVPLATPPCFPAEDSGGRSFLGATLACRKVLTCLIVTDDVRSLY